MFRIVFVIDILNGKVVHAIRGERAAYRPVRNSKVCDSTDPVEMIAALNPKEVYIADLDRLQHIGNNFEAINKITYLTGTMVNIGVEKIEDIEKCGMIADTVILSTEASSLDIMEYASKNHPGRTSITIDIKNGKVLTKDEKLRQEPEELIKLFNKLNIKDVVIIDLTRVGSSDGINENFLSELTAISRHNILFGGGIRDMNDVETLNEIGLSGALVATAVHNGRISAELIR